MIKGFRKLTSRKSLSSKTTNTNATASNSIDSGSGNGSASDSGKDGGYTNTSTSSNAHADAIITKLSNETLEEAYFRLKNEEFQKAKIVRTALAIPSTPSTSAQAPAAPAALTSASTPSTSNSKAKQKSFRRNKKPRRNNGNSGTSKSQSQSQSQSHQLISISSMSTDMDDTNNIDKELVSPAKNSTKSLATGVTRNDGTGIGIDGTSTAEVHSDGSVKSIPTATGASPQQEQHQDGDGGKNDTTVTSTTSLSSSSPSSPTSPTNPPLPLKPTPTPKTEGPRRTMSKDSIKKDESKLKKILIRLISGVSMVGVFVSFMFCGHIYICTLIFLTEIMLFRELVKVRYNTFFHIIEETIPLFRTTQWMWFITAIFYTYSDFVVDIIKSNTSTHYLLDSYNVSQCATSLSFLLYSTTFVVSIATMHKDHIRFQVNQLCWTILVLCLTVGQLKYIMHNVYNGLIWFALPIMLVVFNDSFAWLGGVTCGRKFIDRELMALSPNKTWEGFVVGWIGTMVAGWHLSRYMAQFTWMTCPTNSFSLLPESLDCELDPIFQKAKHIFPSQIFEVLPRPIVHMIPGVVDICISSSPALDTTGEGSDSILDGVMGEMGGATATTLTACVSGNEHHTHHHFELVLKNFYPVQIHALGLSLFASFVAPFGGFLASAIKRAYGLKDFASFIPGHGGMMDRMDCQLLMALCTWVHYNTFVKMATVSLPKMIYMYNNLNELEQKEFLKRITELGEGQ